MDTLEARAFWNRTARRYDGSMRLLGGPLPAMNARVVAELRGSGRVLEVAAGTGLVTRALAPVVGALVATDDAAAMVDQLRGRVREERLNNVRVAVQDLYQPLSDELFDAVVAANVLHLVPDLPGALASLRASVRPGGRVVVPTYCHAQTWSARLVSSVMGVFGFPGQRRLSLASLVEAVETSGLQVQRAECLPGLLPIGFVSAVVP